MIKLDQHKQVRIMDNMEDSKISSANLEVKEEEDKIWEEWTFKIYLEIFLAQEEEIVDKLILSKQIILYLRLRYLSMKLLMEQPK